MASPVASPMHSRTPSREVVGITPQVIGELKQAQAAMNEAASAAGVSVAARVAEAEEEEAARGSSASARWQQAGGVVAAVSQAARLRSELEAAHQTIRQLETRAETAEVRPRRPRSNPQPQPPDPNP